MAVDNDALVVKIRADIKSLQAGLRQAAKEADIAGNAMQSSLGGAATNVQKIIANMVSSVGAGLVTIAGGAVLASAALAGITRRSLEFADSLVKASDMTGIGTEALQEYRYAAAQAGVSTDELEQGLALYTKRVGEARNGNVEAIKSFKSLGISQEELKANSPEQTLARVFQILETIPGAADRAAYANEAFGKSGLRLAILAGQGAGAIDEMRKKARDLGLVVGDDLVRAGDDAGDSIDTLKNVIASGLNKAVLAAAPDIKKFVEEVTSDPQKIQEVTREIINAAGAVAQLGVASAKWIGSVGDFLDRMSFKDAVADASSAAKQIDFFRERLAQAQSLGLTSQVEILTQSLRVAEGAFKDADTARMKFAKGAIGKAIGFDPLAITKQPQAGAEFPFRDPKVPDPNAPKVENLNADAEAKAAARAAAARKATADRELKDQQKQDESLIQQSREFVATEAALEEMRYQARRQALLKINADQFGGETSKNGLLESLAQKHQDTLDAIEMGAAERQRQMREQTYASLEGLMLDQDAKDIQASEARRDSQLAMLAQTQEDELEVFGGYNAVREQIWQEHNDRMTEIQSAALEKQLQNEIDAATRRFSFTQFAGSKEAKYAAGLGDKALALGASQNKKIFELTKKLNLAQAIVALPTAVMESYKNAGGFPFGIPAAAAMGAIGLANIASIRNAQYGGGASPNLPGAAAAGGGVVGDQNAPRGNGGGAAAPQISLSLVGDNFSRDQVRQLIESINEALGDGAKLRTA